MVVSQRKTPQAKTDIAPIKDSVQTAEIISDDSLIIFLTRHVLTAIKNKDFEQLAAGEPPHMYPSDVILENGEVLTAFLYPRELVETYQWEDISDRGGWAAYKANS